MPYFENFWKNYVYTENVPDKNRLITYIKQFIGQKNVTQIGKALIEYDAGDIIGQINKETLILAGKRDYRTPFEDALELKKSIGDDICSIKTYEDAGHCIMEDEPEAFINEISEFCHKEISEGGEEEDNY